MNKLALTLLIALGGANVYAEQPITLEAIETAAANSEVKATAVALQQDDAAIQQEVTRCLKLNEQQKAEFKSFFSRHKTAIYTLGTILVAVGAYAAVGGIAYKYQDANGNWFKKACDKTYAYGYDAKYAPFHMAKVGCTWTGEKASDTLAWAGKNKVATTAIIVGVIAASALIYDLTRADKSVTKKLYHKLFDDKKATELLNEAEKAEVKETVAA